MPNFNIKIAGQVAAVSATFESTRDYCRAYLTQDAPDFSVTVTGEDLVFEQEASEIEAQQEGLRPRIFSQPFLERASIQRKIAEYLITHDTLLFHGSAVAVDGEGYLFTGRCGMGKSTHTRLWREVFGTRAVMVNDDKPFLRVTETGILVCGSPWSGKHGLDTNITVPLKGICILTRGRENRIRRADSREAKAMLLHQSSRPMDEGRQVRFTELVDALAKNTPLWQMECTKEPQAALVSYGAMSGKSHTHSNPRLR